MRKLFFRADAGPEIGYGHFIRSLALVDMLKKDFDCSFFTTAPTSYQIGEMLKVCPYVALQEDSKFEDFLNQLQGDEVVVLDNYFYTTEYQRKIKEKGCKLVCVDDMHDKHYVADLVINHAVNDSSLFDIEPYTELAIGYRWALLRRPFFEGKLKEKPTTINKMAVCFGGVDDFNLTKAVVTKALEQRDGITIIAIIGDGYADKDKVKSERVKYLHNLTAQQMAEVFTDADLSVVPTSGVCLESLACGTFVAAGTYCDNQEYVYSDYVRNNLIYPLGDMSKIKADKLNLDEIEVAFQKLQRLSEIKKTPQNYVELFNRLFK